jgi:Domain of unknown function (DUF4386)
MESLKTTARATGLWYLGVGLTGMLGFLLIRPQLYIVGDAHLTVARLTERSALAHLGVALEVALVGVQAMAALWFYKLFVSLNRVAAVGVLVFGMMNCVAIMVSAIAMSAILSVIADPHLAPGGDVASTVALLVAISSAAWSVGGLFFGFWLIPMGWVAAMSGRFPRTLGWILIVGGGGYVLGALLSAGWAGAPKSLIEALPLPATVGEFWMIGYLLSKGIRPSQAGS